MLGVGWGMEGGRRAVECMRCLANDIAVKIRVSAKVAQFC